MLDRRRILAGGNREVRRIELSERVLRHRRGVGVRDDCRNRLGTHRRAALVRDLHVAGRTRGTRLFVLADLTVVVRDQRTVPVVLGADVFHDRSVHGALACDCGRAGAAK